MELTIKKQTEETINVFPPLYFKKDHKYLGLISEEQVISFSSKNNYSTYANAETWLYKSELSNAINEGWEELSEADFIAAHEAFLAAQSLKPVLISNNPDDLTGIL